MWGTGSQMYVTGVQLLRAGWPDSHRQQQRQRRCFIAHELDECSLMCYETPFLQKQVDVILGIAAAGGYCWIWQSAEVRRWRIWQLGSCTPNCLPQLPSQTSTHSRCHFAVMLLSCIIIFLPHHLARSHFRVIS
jgi:hypothetical protein